MSAPTASRKAATVLVAALIGAALAHAAGTQYLAREMSYADEFLGEPVAIDEGLGVKIYAPWSSYAWIGAYWGGRLQRELSIALAIQAAGTAAGLALGLALARAMRARVASGAHGTSEWASPKEIESWGLTLSPVDRLRALESEGKRRARRGQAPAPKSSACSIVIGKSQKGEHYYDNGVEHVLMASPTRTGKGVGVILPTLLTWTGSVIVTDPKGENYKISGWWRSTFSHVVYFNPSDPNSARFNPMLEIRPDRVVSDAKNLARILMAKGAGEKEDAFWDGGARTILEASIVHALMIPGESTIGRVADLLASFKDELTRMAQCTYPGRAEEQGFVRKAAGSIREQESDKIRGGWLAGAQRALDLWGDPLVRRATSASDFRLKDLQYAPSPVSLFLVMPPTDLAKFGPLIRLLFTQATDVLTESFEDPKLGGGGHRLLMLLDEFPQYGAMPKVERAIAITAGYGIKWLFIAQGLDQLDKIYGDKNGFLSGCRTRLFYRANDERVARRVSELTGEGTFWKEQEGESGKKAIVASLSNRSVSHVEVGRPLLTPGEVMQLPETDEIVLIAGRKPVLAKKVTYYDDPAFLPKFEGRALELPSRPLDDFPPYEPSPWERAPAPAGIYAEPLDLGGGPAGPPPRKASPEEAAERSASLTTAMTNEEATEHVTQEPDPAAVAAIRRAAVASADGPGPAGEASGEVELVDFGEFAFDDSFDPEAIEPGGGLASLAAAAPLGGDEFGAPDWGEDTESEDAGPASLAPPRGGEPAHADAPTAALTPELIERLKSEDRGGGP